MTVGQNVKRCRKRLGLTQIDLANRLDMAQSYLSDIERDRHNPSLDALKALAKALGVDTAELVKDCEKYEKAQQTPAERLVEQSGENVKDILQKLISNDQRVAELLSDPAIVDRIETNLKNAIENNLKLTLQMLVDFHGENGS